MELKEAKEIIKQAINAAMKAGVYGLDDASVILQAISKIETLDDVAFGEIKKVNK